MVVQSSGKMQTKGITVDEIPVTIYYTSTKDFHVELFRKTGNDNHVKKVFVKIKGAHNPNSEAEIYKKAFSPVICPRIVV